MERKIVWTGRASGDIEAIVRYIARRDPNAAGRIGAGIYHAYPVATQSRNDPLQVVVAGYADLHGLLWVLMPVPGDGLAITQNDIMSLVNGFAFKLCRNISYAEGMGSPAAPRPGGTLFVFPIGLF